MSGGKRSENDFSTGEGELPRFKTRDSYAGMGTRAAMYKSPICRRSSTLNRPESIESKTGGLSSVGCRVSAFPVQVALFVLFEGATVHPDSSLRVVSVLNRAFLLHPHDPEMGWGGTRKLKATEGRGAAAAKALSSNVEWTSGRGGVV